MATQVEVPQAFSALTKYLCGEINKYADEVCTKKKSAYGIFFQEQHHELKDEIDKISERSKEIAKRWKGLSDTEKKVYEQKAKEWKPNKAKVVGRKGHLNSFQLFCKEKREKAKNDDPNQNLGQRELSIMWKKVSDKHKDKYKAKADEYNKHLDKKKGKKEKKQEKVEDSDSDSD